MQGPQEAPRFAKVLVGVDGEHGGRDALALARALVAPGGEIVLVHVYPYEPRFRLLAEPEVEAALREEAMDRLWAVAGHDAEVTRELVPCTSPARGLRRAAERLGADLVVVGSCHRGALGRVLLGDTARATLHGAECPVAVAPHGHAHRHTAIRSIGVGFDGRSDAWSALTCAAELAARAGAVLRLVTALPAPTAFAPSDAYTFDFEGSATAARAAAEAALDAALGEIDVPATGLVIEGSPGQVLARLSEEVDLLVAGSRGLGALKRVLLGSTTGRLVRDAACPVVVVPHAVTVAAQHAAQARVA